MKNIKKYPRTIIKTIRYIKQDAPKEQLEEIRKLVENAIKIRISRVD